MPATTSVESILARLARIEAALEFAGILRKPVQQTISMVGGHGGYSGGVPTSYQQLHTHSANMPLSYVKFNQHDHQDQVVLTDSEGKVQVVTPVKEPPVPLGTSEGKPETVPAHLAGIWSK